ncbi:MULTISPECIES: DUF4276 family protein [unclassified Rhizobacter]|uniref:DUF4276 family protein n=1 Tax=unclassified Rhizobacter TaxID=2640088 RepID=UPI0006F6AE2D|nr:MULTISPECIES: DUF4276 family protein [unclassified Rhizobacter]KQU80359.1 hypothetical protein ASC88_17175 [Rhizobacter sp. Root29]KQW13857.1 hypothetical protein ASC98_17305 [Rhizobacter sp. Root1238]KRB20389.1 hypothetical protein ASE08_22340 [Rhizobacter sp. Root16D2]
MISIASIVEGDGEVSALPILLRRLASEREPSALVNLLQPIRVRRDKFLNKDDEFRRQLLLAAAKSGPDGWVLVVLDADDDCPATLGRDIHERAQQHIPHQRLSVVLANREFEAWFIAAAHSLQGVRGFSSGPEEPLRAETPRNAKGWMRERMRSGTYSEILDQPAFAARIDLQQAFDNSRSFRKLCKEWQTHVAARI